MIGGVNIMRINPKVLSEFKYSYLNVDVDLRFSDNLIFITGESATGKSFLYTIFNTAQASIDEIETFNFTSLKKDILSSIKNLNNKLIVIDNADILLDDEAREYIAFDCSNQYIIIGRDPRNLMLMTHQIKEIKFMNNILSLE